MTMLFRQIKANLVGILGNDADGRYVVVGYQNQKKAASNLLGNKQTVQVFYREGEHPKEQSGTTGNIEHDMAFEVVLTVAAKATADVATLENENSTEPQRATALANVNTAAALIDDKMDDLIDVVWNVLMDARHEDLGSDDVGNPIAELDVFDRWVQGQKKSEPFIEGEDAVLRTKMLFTIGGLEQTLGEEPALLEKPVFDIDISEDGDDETKTGVTVNPPPP